MSKTPLILLAGKYLLENSALEINQELVSTIANYESQAFVTSFATMISNLQGDGSISGGNISTMTHLFDNSMPWLPNIAKLSEGLTTDFITTYISQHGDNIMGNGNNSVFVTNLLSILGYTQLTNSAINSAINGDRLAENTFTSMDALTTGNITAVNKFTKEFGQDLINTGLLYDFSKLTTIGSPQSLLERLSFTDTLNSLLAEFNAVGLDVYLLEDLMLDNPDKSMKPLAQKKAYDVFTTITGQQLQDILFVLGIETQGINTLADLLDITKMFPTSFGTMTSLNNGEVDFIFTTDTTNIAPWVAALSTTLSAVMPTDIAKANSAFCIAMQQIKGIHTVDPIELGKQTLGLETSLGLTEINALTEAVSDVITDFYTNMLGKGSGPNNTFYVTDGVGTATGDNHIENITTIIDAIITLQNTAQLDPFDDVLTVITNLTNGTYDTGSPPEVLIPDGLPGGGVTPPGITYDNHDQAMDWITLEAITIVSGIAAANTAIATATLPAYEAILAQIELELQTFKDAAVQFTQTYNPTFDGTTPIPLSDSQTVLLFAANLHIYGNLTDKGNMAEILEKLATTTIGGQSIIAAMREGRNLKKLANANITPENAISDEPTIVESGDISPSFYT